MAVTTAVLRAACNTTTGNQDFTTTDFGGGTPTSCLAIISGSTVDGTEAQYRFLWGSSVGATEGSACSIAEDNVGTTNTRRTSSADSFAMCDENGANYAEGTVSMITNGIRVNWSDAPTHALLMTVILLGGADLSAHHHNTPASWNDLDTTTATTNFQPELIIGGTSDAIQYNNDYASMGIAHGVYDWDGGTSPRSMSYAAIMGDNDATSSSGSEYSNTRILSWPLQTTGVADHSINVSAITSTSYTLQNTSGGVIRNTWAQALNLGGNQYKAWEQASPTTTGNWSVTGVGFKPQIVIGYLGFLTTAAADNAGTDAGVHAITVFTPSAEFCNTGLLEDGAASAIRAKGLSDNTAVNMTLSDGTGGFAGSFVSMDADGFTLNFSAVDSTARKWTFIAIEEDVTGHTSNLALGTMTPFGLDPAITLTQEQWSNLAQGTESVTGFAPTVTLTAGDESILAQGAATATGFDPTVTLTQDATTTLAQGTATSAGFDPTVTLTQNAITTLAQGTATSTGFAPTVTLLEGDQTTLVQGVATAATFDPTVTLTQDATSTLAQGASTATGFGPTVTVGAGEISNLVAGAATAATFTPTVTLTQNLVSTLASGTFIVNGLVPTIEVTGVAPAVKRRGGAAGAKKKHYRRVMIAGIVYKVSSVEEELALWKAHLMKVREETPGRLGEIEARSIERKITVVEKRVEAAKARPRKKEELLVKYVAARRKIVRTKIQELLESLR